MFSTIFSFPVLEGKVTDVKLNFIDQEITIVSTYIKIECFFLGF